MTSSPPRSDIAPVLSADHWSLLVAIADTLIPATDRVAAPGDLEDYRSWVQRALLARPDCVDDLRQVLDSLAGKDLPAALRRLDAEQPATFAVLATIIAGAYVMHPQVLRAVNYPGQHRNPAPFDAAANELATGILDPVLNAAPVIRTLTGD
jgi:hypothetical protein